MNLKSKMGMFFGKPIEWMRDAEIETEIANIKAECPLSKKSEDRLRSLLIEQIYRSSKKVEALTNELRSKSHGHF